MENFSSSGGIKKQNHAELERKIKATYCKLTVMQTQENEICKPAFACSVLRPSPDMFLITRLNFDYGLFSLRKFT